MRVVTVACDRQVDKSLSALGDLHVALEMDDKPSVGVVCKWIGSAAWDATEHQRRVKDVTAFLGDDEANVPAFVHGVEKWDGAYSDELNELLLDTVMLKCKKESTAAADRERLHAWLATELLMLRSASAMRRAIGKHEPSVLGERLRLGDAVQRGGIVGKAAVELLAALVLVDARFVAAFEHVVTAGNDARAAQQRAKAARAVAERLPGLVEKWYYSQGALRGVSGQAV
jgi:hypothetical protein